MRAALINQYANDDRQRRIAAGIDAQIIAGMKRGNPRDGHAARTPGE